MCFSKCPTANALFLDHHAITCTHNTLPKHTSHPPLRSPPPPQASDLAEQDAQRVPLTEEQLAANDSVVKTLIHTCRTWERDLAAMVGQLESLRVEVLQEEIRELTDGLEEKTDALVQMTEHRDTLQTEVWHDHIMLGGGNAVASMAVVLSR